MTKEGWIEDDDIVQTEAFYVERADKETKRFELSVNWEDDAGALPALRGNVAAFGVCRLLRAVLDECNKLLHSPVTAERAPEDGNPYHGNLVFVERTSRRRQAASYLATHAHVVRKGRS